MIYRYLVVALMLGSTPGLAQEQMEVSGVIQDAKSKLPIGDVSVRSKEGGAISDALGRFTIASKLGDTLTFRHLSYEVVTVVVTGSNLTVKMNEASRTLDTVTIELGPMMPQLYFKPFKPQQFSLRNSSDTTHYQENLVPTIGPTIVFNGLLDRLTRGARAEKRLKAVREDLKRSQVYRTLISAPSTKELITKKFSINDEVYYKLLLAFNQEYPEVSYWTSEEEILEFLFYYIGKNKE